jgi:hypothetical protein
LRTLSAPAALSLLLLRASLPAINGAGASRGNVAYAVDRLTNDESGRDFIRMLIRQAELARRRAPPPRNNEVRLIRLIGWRWKWR